ncbi:MAG: VWA domain-containing protein [Pyrinomonadaceae bacterium]|nr:VWA domain-containing protein [Pyrinomonadaceae bacterium]
MKKYSLSLAIALFCFVPVSVFSQASRPIPGNTKKANKRPEEKKKKPEFVNDVIDESIETDDEIITVDTDLVTVPVRVLDRQGRFVSGLAKADFNILEDKLPQEITYFSNEEKPFTVALVLDMSYSSTFKIDEIQQAALTFVSELRPNDKVMVVSFDEALHILCEPTSDRKTLEQAIIKTRIGSGTSVYQAVDFVINKRLAKVNGRKAIVLFTDGVDTTSKESDDRKNLRDAMELDSLIYPIRYDTFADVQAIQSGRVIIRDPQTQTTTTANGSRIPTGGTQPRSPLSIPLPTGTIGTGRPTRSLPGSGTSKEEYARAEKYLDQMAQRTGGRVYEANNPSTLARAFSKIASELREFYSLGYYPSEEKAAGKRRRIKVKVNRKKVAVKARDSYVVKRKKGKN